MNELHAQGAVRRMGLPLFHVATGLAVALVVVGYGLVLEAASANPLVFWMSRAKV